MVANLSTNSFPGEIGSSIDGCAKLEYVAMSSNSLTENLSFGFQRILTAVATMGGGGVTITAEFLTESVIIELKDNRLKDNIVPLPLPISSQIRRLPVDWNQNTAAMIKFLERDRGFLIWRQSGDFQSIGIRKRRQ
ncbi:hypothetical protein L1887_14616 [Cichorium endivia]|nr:hypothetical protein L1887_14616 [Cichorium endivia]